jgi:plastocyanin
MPRLAAAALLAASVALAACGSSSSSKDASAPSGGAYGSATSSATTGTTTAASSAGGTVKLTADPGGALSFDTSTLKAKAGTVTIDLANPQTSGIPHAIAIQGNGIDKDGKIVQPGGTSSVTVSLKPGTYTYYCPVPGHKAAGMSGTLTVS